jgi:Xaa-Pro aminopeptidase
LTVLLPLFNISINLNKPIPKMTSSSVFSDRLASLRHAMKRDGLDAILVPMSDEYLSEYVPASAKRIEFLSGFTGSAGFIVVTSDEAAFFTDSRYTLQAERQVAREWFTIYDSFVKTPMVWIKEKSTIKRIGFDPRLHSAASIDRWKKEMTAIEAEMVPLAANPIDPFWKERPFPPSAPIHAYDIAFAGKTSSEKRQEIAQKLAAMKKDAVILSDANSIAWLLNVRGGDIPMAPIPLSYAILYKDGGVDWFVEPDKLTPELPSFLGPQVRPQKPKTFPDFLEKLGQDKANILLDPQNTPYAFLDCLEKAGALIEKGEDPCLLPKACKNEIELDGMRSCHRRDGAALVSFLSWLDRQDMTTELEIESKLEEFRSLGEHWRGPSFDTIAGSGPNGAIVHYRATTETSRTLKKGEFLLLDTGAQYLDGTTDVTRTIPYGAVLPEMRENFTRVLKGHIALASIKFPSGIAGADLDILARQYLWQVGLDYGHGTGHGVGTYLSVHEGPQSISRYSKIALQPGMVVSNEPGYYKANEYGIRIESLLAVIEAPEITQNGQKMLAFETLTLAPIDHRAIEFSMLTKDEVFWLDSYHKRVRETLSPLIEDKEVLSWLERMTRPIDSWNAV